MGRSFDTEQLAAELEVLSLRIAAVEVQTDEFDEGTIIGQAPAAGTLQPGGITVTVEVAEAPELAPVVMPDVVGLSEGEARQVLAAAGLGVETVVEPYFDEVAGQFIGEPGAVWGQDPAPGTALEPGSSATIRVNPGL